MVEEVAKILQGTGGSFSSHWQRRRQLLLDPAAGIFASWQSDFVELRTKMPFLAWGT